MAEYDRQADAVREGGGGFWARRYARKHDVPNGLRWFAVPLTLILREDQDPEKPLALEDRPVRPAAAAEARHTRADPYKKGAYHKVVDSFYDDVVARRPRPLRRRRGRPLHGHRPRALLEQDQAQRQRQDQAQDQEQEEERAERHALGAQAQLRALPRRRPRRAEGDRQARREPHRRSSSAGTMVQPNADAVPPIRMLLELISGAYERVEPARRKKL